MARAANLVDEEEGASLLSTKTIHASPRTLTSAYRHRAPSLLLAVRRPSH